MWSPLALGLKTRHALQPAVEDTSDFAFEIVISARVYFIVAASQQVCPSPRTTRTTPHTATPSDDRGRV